MKLGFVGADHEVTGSCHYLEACGKQILIDCGMEQGKEYLCKPGYSCTDQPDRLCSTDTRTYRSFGSSATSV